MFYPNAYFNLAQWSNDPDEDNQLGRSVYQYGTPTSSVAFCEFPAAAAFSAVAPFDFLRVGDGNTVYVFTFRPDVAPGPAIVVGRNVQVNIQGLTATQIAQAFVDAVGDVNVFDSPATPTARLKVIARLHGTPNTRVTLIQLQPGIRGLLDVTGITGVAGFAAAGFFGSNTGTGKSYAAGIILPVVGADLVDTETLVITAPDTSAPIGNTLQVTFEFDSDGAVVAGRTPIPFTAGDTLFTVASTIAAQINNTAAPPVGGIGPGGRGPDFGMRAFVVTAGAIVYVVLRTTIPGILGVFNPIAETVASPFFIAFGMGGAYDNAIMAPLRWGLSRGAFPNAFGQETQQEG